MFERHPHLIAFRGLVVAVCLVLLAGCLPKTNNPAAPIPTGLQATAGDASVSLAWTASTGATGYYVKRGSSSSGPFTQIGSPNTNSFSDSGLKNGTTYYYVVSAINMNGESGNSAEASATPQAPSAPPPTPTNLVATGGDTVVALTWTASTGASSYNVKRSTTNGGPYTTIATTTAPTYSDTAVTNGTTYYYVVSAINGAGESTNSTQVVGLPSPPPPTTFGTWINVTPATGVDLTTNFACGNFGATTIQADPANAGNIYTEFNCQGIWKSTDYGQTWTGPINTGANGAAVGDCSGGIALSPYSSAAVPTLYETCFRGAGTGFWKSTNGGKDWTKYTVTPGGTRQDYFPPSTDPYDELHLLMAGHEHDSLVESVDGGQTWTAVPVAAGMNQNTSGGANSGAIFFVDTGAAGTTRGNWLWMGQQNGGVYGTWRTNNSGVTWVQVDKNEHGGYPQVYQPDKSGAFFMAGANSALGPGVLRSSDFGQTWAHVGVSTNEAVVFGTSKNVYGMYGYPVGAGQKTDPSMEIASQPGTGTWVQPGATATPAGLTQGPGQVALVNDGTHNIAVGAMYNAGVWRYVEP